MTAQNQHYVPKFILRNFLSNSADERVSVYDKHTDRTFVTSIKNIMAERRFNEFRFDDNYIVSFEPIACSAEEHVLPFYRDILSKRRLTGTPEEKAALSIFIAFQMVRTKSHRDHWKSIEEGLVSIVEKSGGRMQDVRGWEDWKPSTEDSIKQNHLTAIKESLPEFARIIATKDMFLAEAMPGRRFYLGDNPVSLANTRVRPGRGNLGLSVLGIEIYLPLAADLMLCAWCPSIFQEIQEENRLSKMGRRNEFIARARAGNFSLADMKRLLAQLEEMERPVEEIITAASEGRPMPSREQNMDYYNSLQTSWAYRYVICQNADFKLARRFNRENADLRQGRRLTFG